VDARPEEVIPSIIPARMVNEFLYCPRFFHLAYVGRETGENDHTVDGKWIHRRIDRASIRADGDKTQIRSHSLVSERLGLSAKVDVVEIDGNRAVPVEFKRGKPKDGEHPVWMPERAQLAVAGLLLRDEGYTCDHGEVWFDGTRRRVEVPFTDELIHAVRRAVQQMRQLAQSPTPPEPLEDSPKCPACIYVGICLPDEKYLLRDRRSDPPRRLLPADDPAQPLYVTSPGARVGRDGDRAVIRLDGSVVASHRLIDVSQVAVFGNVSVSTPLLRELMARDVPICYFTSGGWFSGMTTGLPSKNVEIRRRQAQLADAVEIGLARRFVEAKILNQRTLLRRNSTMKDESALRELKRLAVRATRTEDPEKLLGLEGAAARLYFSSFDRMLKVDDTSFDFEKRNRRPPLDRTNALLSFTYGLLVRDLTAICWSVGLDPYLGVFHRPRFGRPAMALDLAEEFRPLIGDSVVINLINNRVLGDRDFIEAAGAVSLSQSGRRAVIRAYERRVSTELTHPLFGYSVTYRRAFELQTRLAAAVIMGEFDEYRGIVTR
jgi:CRISPR-associated protein Cas1